MASHTPVTDRILGTVQRTHGCDLDTLTNSLSDLSWGQVFLEVDRLSREGQVLVTLDTGGRYMIRLPDHNKGPATHHVQSWSTKGSQGIAK
jgi:predicted  nucleic acid-binding Zn-ribbon protein